MALEQKIASIKEPAASHAFDSKPAEMNQNNSNLSTLANKPAAQMQKTSSQKIYVNKY